MMKARLALLAFLALSGAAYAQTDTTITDTTVTDTTVTDSTSDSTTTLRYGRTPAAGTLEMRTAGAGLVFEVTEADRPLRFRIVDMTGRTVWFATASPVNGRVSVTWSGLAANGRRLSSGMYVVRALAQNGQRESALMERRFIHRY